MNSMELELKQIEPKIKKLIKQGHEIEVRKFDHATFYYIDKIVIKHGLDDHLVIKVKDVQVYNKYCLIEIIGFVNRLNTYTFRNYEENIFDYLDN